METTKIERTKEECEKAFMQHYNLTESDMSYLWKLFMNYGMTKGEADYRSHGNHAYLEAISQNYCLEYDTWSKLMTPKLKKILHEKYPQLLVNDKQFEY